jgi:hypothetical protein
MSGDVKHKRSTEDRNSEDFRIAEDRQRKDERKTEDRSVEDYRYNEDRRTGPDDRRVPSIKAWLMDNLLTIINIISIAGIAVWVGININEQATQDKRIDTLTERANKNAQGIVELDKGLVKLDSMGNDISSIKTDIREIKNILYVPVMQPQPKSIAKE